MSYDDMIERLKDRQEQRKNAGIDFGLGEENYSAISSKIRRLEAENNSLRAVVEDLCDTIDRNLICDLGPTRLADIRAALDRAKNMTPNAEVNGAGTASA